MGHLNKTIYLFLTIAVLQQIPICTTMFAAASHPNTTDMLSEKLKEFVERKLSVYPAWLNSSSQNPPPFVPGPTPFQATNAVIMLDGYFENHGMEFFSTPREHSYVQTDFDGRWFSIGINLSRGWKLLGQYKANGTIHSWLPISGEGDWYMIEPVLDFSNFNISFNVESSGYLNVSGYHLDRATISLSEPSGEVFFEKIMESDPAARFEDFFSDAFLKGINEFLKNDREQGKHPAISLYLKYWQQVLSETTLEDIIG